MSETCPTCGGVVKRCPRCGEMLPASAFTRAKRADGLSWDCRRCQKAVRDDPERKAKQAEINRRWRAEHPNGKPPTLEQRLAALERKLR
jgi:hypothetical protein